MLNLESDYHKPEIRKIISQEVSKSQSLSFWMQNNPRNLASLCPAFLPPSSISTANISSPLGCEVCCRSRSSLACVRCDYTVTRDHTAFVVTNVCTSRITSLKSLGGHPESNSTRTHRPTGRMLVCVWGGGLTTTLIPPATCS